MFPPLLRKGSLEWHPSGVPFGLLLTRPGDGFPGFLPLFVFTGLAPIPGYWSGVRRLPGRKLWLAFPTPNGAFSAIPGPQIPTGSGSRITGFWASGALDVQADARFRCQPLRLGGVFFEHPALGCEVERGGHPGVDRPIASVLGPGFGFGLKLVGKGRVFPEQGPLLGKIELVGHPRVVALLFAGRHEQVRIFVNRRLYGIGQGHGVGLLVEPGLAVRILEDQVDRPVRLKLGLGLAGDTHPDQPGITAPAILGHGRRPDNDGLFDEGLFHGLKPGELLLLLLNGFLKGHLLQEQLLMRFCGEVHVLQDSIENPNHTLHDGGLIGEILVFAESRLVVFEPGQVIGGVESGQGLSMEGCLHAKSHFLQRSDLLIH